MEGQNVAFIATYEKGSGKEPEYFYTVYSAFNCINANQNSKWYHKYSSIKISRQE
jgi:hypothetical protein